MMAGGDLEAFIFSIQVWASNNRNRNDVHYIILQ